MSEMIHFEAYSVVAGNVRVDIRFDRFARQFTDAQQWLGDTVLQDCKPFMPMGETGYLQQQSKVLSGGKNVVFPGPYARFQYGGLVMVDPETGSPWARPGVRNKVLTDRKLVYSSPTATDHWFDAAKAAHGEYWIAEVKRRAGG